MVWGSNIWEIGSGGKDCLLKFLVGGQNLGKLVGVKSLVGDVGQNLGKMVGGEIFGMGVKSFGMGVKFGEIGRG